MTATNRNTVWENTPTTALLRLAWPIAVSMLSFSAMSMIDTAFVGHISAAALAGVGLASLLVFTLACFGIGLLRAVKTTTAQSVGANTGDRGAIISAALVCAGVLGLISVAVGVLAAPSLDHVAGDPEAASCATSYFEVRLWSLPLLFAYVALREFSYGLGHTRPPMLASVLANACNALLDYVFIVELNFGTAGAAWASVTAQAVELLFLWIALRPRLSRLAAIRGYLREIWRLGLPTGLQFLVEVSSFTISGLIIASISTVEMAAHQIAIHVLHLSFLPAHAIGEAGSVLAGQAAGARRLDLVGRVAKRTLATTSLYTAAFTIALAIGASTVGALFTTDMRVAELAGVLLVFSTSFQIVDGAAIVAGSILRGVGDVRYAAIASIGAAWLCTPTCTYILGLRMGMGALGAWIGIALELALIGALLWSRLLSGTWRARAIQTTDRVEAAG